MAKPGVMIYFEVKEALKILNDRQKGKLFEAILDYGEYGVDPELAAPEMKMAWAFIKARIDRDGNAYERKVALSKYAVYCRVEKRRGFKPVDFETWQTAMEGEE